MQKDLGGLPPEQALDYMEKTPDLVIVNVAGRGFWTEDIGDDASIEKIKELPAGRPVIMHCRRGHMVVDWYQKLKALRPDIPEVSYIAGVPPFDAYNDWARNK